MGWNDDSRVAYNTNSRTEFKILMLRSSVCDYSATYILVSGTITITGVSGTDDAAKRIN